MTNTATDEIMFLFEKGLHNLTKEELDQVVNYCWVNAERGQRQGTTEVKFVNLPNNQCIFWKSRSATLNQRLCNPEQPEIEDTYTVYGGVDKYFIDRCSVRAKIKAMSFSDKDKFWWVDFDDIYDAAKFIQEFEIQIHSK